MINSVNKIPIYELLSSDSPHYYKNPKYQRAYSWSPHEWEALYDDIGENDSGYFMGSIICILPKNENNFEDKIRELEVIVKELESGEVNLDDAIEKYTKAMKLAKECSDKLNKATEKVNKILKENGTLEEFKVEE